MTSKFLAPTEANAREFNNIFDIFPISDFLFSQMMQARGGIETHQRNAIEECGSHSDMIMLDYKLDNYVQGNCLINITKVSLLPKS